MKGLVQAILDQRDALSRKLGSPVTWRTICVGLPRTATTSNVVPQTHLLLSRDQLSPGNIVYTMEASHEGVHGTEQWGPTEFFGTVEDDAWQLDTIFGTSADEWLEGVDRVRVVDITFVIQTSFVQVTK